MWLDGQYIENDEEWFRLNKDHIRPQHFENIDLKNLSKDFFREFRDKMEWRDIFGGLTLPALHVWKKFGEKFMMEMSYDDIRRREKQKN